MPQKWTWIPRELPGGRASFIHVFEPVEDGQTRGANVFYSVMEQMKMLDTLQNTQLQSAIVKAMYAATIESELDTQSAMDFILGANSQEQRERLTGWIGEIAAYYAAAPVRLGGAKVPHLMPGDSLNLQTAQDTDTRAYKIRFPNGTVDVFRGWISSIGKAVTAKEVITRTVKVTNVGRPSMAEDRSTVTAATGMTVTPASASVVKGKSTTLTVAFQPEGATDKSFRAVSADKTKATVSVSGMTITVNGVAAGKVNIPVVSGNGEFAAVAEITVTAS
ncbi:phage portal protein [Escherichia coli]|nr:phage portal protein [Escherichia coli]MED0501231.1 phage portal protein [Escherichia coli]